MYVSGPASRTVPVIPFIFYHQRFFNSIAKLFLVEVFKTPSFPDP